METAVGFLRMAVRQTPKEKKIKTGKHAKTKPKIP